MNDTILTLELAHWEMNIVIKALNELKHNVKDTEDTTIISELILKVIDAPEKKMTSSKSKRDFYER